MAQEKYVAYVGTYTHENSVGIHIYDVDVTKGYMTERKVVPINNPSDLVVSKNRKFLYSIADEGVEAFKVLKDGDLEPINEQWIGGMRGCYVEVDDENRYLFVGGHQRLFDGFEQNLLFDSAGFAKLVQRFNKLNVHAFTPPLCPHIRSRA